ncbi:MAG: hypothetical protein KKA73_10845 [Chloroflexi bacterium]|nr:hypothetical protein [Chloroflexota bacterium]MBU1748174.1 hypothetical protein [Chloroflexota bacterium]MBU1878802.1 hypothetical protein [Chloroflexota bacterium]
MKSQKRTVQRLQRDRVNINREVKRIVCRAAARDTHIVTLEPLVFFSTATGDAWLLDFQDSLALCLARDGDPQPVNIMETTGRFAIEWDLTYHIEENSFIVSDRLGRTRRIVGYPTHEVLDAIQSAGGVTNVP